MEKFVKQSYLYDFYGELLTKHQQEIYEAVSFDDLSLAEVASINGISRQGVHDLVKRCNLILEDYENKLHLVEKFIYIKEKVSLLYELTEKEEPDKEAIRQAAREIYEEL